jgi:hydroxymethylglutaryl-CoA reductase
MNKKTSRIPGFYKLTPDERIRKVAEFTVLTKEEIDYLKNTGALRIDQADKMSENIIGTMQLPLGIAVNFLINSKDYLVPMAIEEPSVIAAASNAARIARDSGGFQVQSMESIMIGQIQVTNLVDLSRSRFLILKEKMKLIEVANKQDPILLSNGGGVRDITAKIISGYSEPMLIVELHVDCRDAMGANIVNTMSEAIAPIIEDITGGTVFLRIVSNLCVDRLVRASVIIKSEVIGGEQVVDGIVKAYEFAAADIFRCATHNKGIMNGITAVALATGNDTRALEAGVHTYAALHGSYRPLTIWEKTKDRNLVGTLELPIAVGIIGGATTTHPIAKLCRKILGVSSAKELSEVMSAVGLAQNFAALKALVTEGIQKGHMKLHARNIAIMAGANNSVIDEIALKMVQENNIKLDRARELLKTFS